MAYRTFTDENGSYWQVWDIRPERRERRSIERRTNRAAPWPGPERRKGERRNTERRGLQQSRVVLASGSATGWLIFESLSESRKLVGIPAGWEKYTQTQLRMLAQKATPFSKITNGNSYTA